jgi:hypothetical protein
MHYADNGDFYFGGKINDWAEDGAHVRRSVPVDFTDTEI